MACGPRWVPDRVMRVERALQTSQQRIEGRSQLAKLIAAQLDTQALMQVLGADLPCSRVHVRSGRRARPGEPPCDRDREQRHNDERDTDHSSSDDASFDCAVLSWTFARVAIASSCRCPDALICLSSFAGDGRSLGPFTVRTLRRRRAIPTGGQPRGLGRRVARLQPSYHCPDTTAQHRRPAWTSIPPDPHGARSSRMWLWPGARTARHG